MPRLRSPLRDQAFELWHASDGKKPLKQIAAELGVTDSQIRKWKNLDKWDERANSNVTNTKSNVPKRAGAPKENKNAVGNQGGAPVGNANAVTHGFFRRIFPDDDETLAIVQDITSMDPLDMLWQNIVIQYTAIARAQRIMFVQSNTDHSEFVISQASGPDSESVSKMIQPAWDKQAHFLEAQSRAMKTLEGLISRYEDLLPTSAKAQEHQLRIEKLRVEIAKLQGVEEGETQDDGFMEALKGRASALWNGGEDDDGNSDSEET